MKTSLVILTVIFFFTITGCNQPKLVTRDSSTQLNHQAILKNANLKKELNQVYPLPREKESEPQVITAAEDKVKPTPQAHLMQMGGVQERFAKVSRIATNLPYTPYFQRESYNALPKNSFIVAKNNPLSTFSIDVDSASYSNIRRFLNDGRLPPVGAVRIEEMVNYFSYNYPQPQNTPFSITTEIGPCLWEPSHSLIRIGIKAKDLDEQQIPQSNIVFLVDVSGSMNMPKKLPLLKQSMLLLVNTLKATDRVTIITYAGSDRLVLPPTSGDKKQLIKEAIRNLHASGSTNGARGIKTAYELAQQNYIASGNNRIILASDGDFNVGITSRGELEKLISEKRKSGIYLTILGFGMGNYHDDTMEILADKGNGNYGYIDSLLEAKKMLLKERSGTLFTIANDVKIQVEFNPEFVGAYKLIGYENRKLNNEDFNNDKKDAGELGAGHTVTAIYELIPKGSSHIPSLDPLKYQTNTLASDSSNELCTVKVRYKPIGSDQSKLVTKNVNNTIRTFDKTSDDYRFVSAVAGFGILLRSLEGSKYIQYPQLLKLARSSRGSDREGYRSEFIHLLETAQLLKNSQN